MSLRVWLPLTKDLRNQGIDKVTVTNNGATFNSAGKLGGCYLLDGTDDYITGTYTATEEITFCAWVYLLTLPSGKHVFDGRTADGSVGYQPMYLTDTQIQIGGTGSTFTYIDYNWTINTWYHICVIHNNTEGKCYINGELIGTTAAHGADMGTCKFTLGSRCNQANYTNIKINDVRIYNHCLSESEVKKIAQGLILHYPLNRNGMGGENLLPYSGNFSSITGWTSNQDTTLSTSNNELKVVLNQNTSTPGIKTTNTINLSAGTYTISMLIKVENGNKDYVNYVGYLNNGSAIYSGAYTKKENKGDYVYEEAVFTISEDASNIVFYILTSSPLTGETWYIKNIKLEKGDKATQWCPYEYSVLNKFLTYDTSLYTESDGSQWLRIAHHNNPGAGVFASTDTFSTRVYKDSNRWYEIEPICDLMSSYEFMVKQKTTSDATETKYRWCQSVSPISATYAQVAPSTVTRITTSGYTDGTFGGLYITNNNARMCIANVNNGNWYGAFGSWTAYQNGIPGYPNTVVTTGYMDLYIRIDNTEYDISGFNNNGYRTGNFEWSTNTPKYKVSTSFNANRITCSNYSALYDLSTATLTAWVKLNSYHSERCMIIFANGRYLTVDNVGKLSGYSYGKTPAGYYNSNATVPLNTWTHLAIVWTDTDWIFYINGEQVNSFGCTGTFVNSSNYVSVGQENNNTRNVDGLISDARIYATALSAEEIQELYNNSEIANSN